jgi:hypothetical protein
MVRMRAHVLMRRPPLLGVLLLTGHALGVDAQQDSHAVPGPLGDLSRRHARAEPRRNGRVPQGVRRLSQVLLPAGSDDFGRAWTCGTVEGLVRGLAGGALDGP